MFLLLFIMLKLHDRLRRLFWLYKINYVLSVVERSVGITSARCMEARLDYVLLLCSHSRMAEISLILDQKLMLSCILRKGNDRLLDLGNRGIIRKLDTMHSCI